MILLFARLVWAGDDETPPPPPTGDPSGTPAPESPPADPPPENRDDDIFGGSSSTPAAEPPPSDTFQGDLGEQSLEKTSDAQILSRLGLADDRLTIGGKLYLRTNVYFREGDEAEDIDVDNPNLLDLYVDARPNDRVRAFVAGRLRYDFTVQDGATDLFGNEQTASSVALDQLWLKFDAGRKVFFTVGRQRVKWGSGRFWNPTDFLNEQTLDALNATVFDERTGVGLVKVHVPFEAAGGNVYVVGNFEGADSVDRIAGAGRVEWILGPGEVALSGAVAKDQPYRLGADLSFAVGPFDLHAEGAVKHGSGLSHYSGTFDLADFYDGSPGWQADDWSDRWVPQVVGGAELGIKVGDDDTLYLGAEYFYNGLGYPDASLYLALLSEDAFTPFYLGQHYAAAYVWLPAPGEWDDTSFTLSSINNLSDTTGVIRLDVSQTVLTYLRLNAYASAYWGTEGGEFHFAFDIPEEYEALASSMGGLSDIPPPVVDVGLGAQVTF